MELETKNPTVPQTASPTLKRLLPWPSEDGNPCYLVSGTESGYLWRLADDMEAEQLAMGADVLDDARKVLDDPMSPYTEVRYAGIRLAECLTDALRVAESRGMRLPVADLEDADDNDDCADNAACADGVDTGEARTLPSGTVPKAAPKKAAPKKAASKKAASKKAASKKAASKKAVRKRTVRKRADPENGT